MKATHVQDIFTNTAKWITDLVASPVGTIIAILLVPAFGIAIAVFGYTETLATVFNLTLSIITYLLAFFILVESKKDQKQAALENKELVRAVQGARDEFTKLEDKSADEIEKLEKEFKHPKKKGAA